MKSRTYRTTETGLKVTRITFDTVTGKEVDPRQEESYTGRFVTQECYWDDIEGWVPADSEQWTHISGSSA